MVIKKLPVRGGGNKSCITGEGGGCEAAIAFEVLRFFFEGGGCGSAFIIGDLNSLTAILKNTFIINNKIKEHIYILFSTKQSKINTILKFRNLF